MRETTRRLLASRPRLSSYVLLCAIAVIGALLSLHGREVVAAWYLNRASVVMSNVSLTSEQVALSALEGLYRQAFHWDLQNRAVRRGLGRLLVEAGRYAEAVTCLRDDRSSADSLSALYLGSAQSNLGNEGAALDTWRAVQAGPYFLNLALTQERAGEMEQAEGSYLRAIDIGPVVSWSPQEKRNVYRYLGDLYRREGRWDDAVEAYQHAILADPSDCEARYSLGWVSAFGLREPLEGIRIYQQGTVWCPRHVWLYLGVGEVYLVQGNHEEAERWFRRAMDVSPESPAPFQYLGRLAMQLGHFEEAIAYYEESRQMGASDTPTLYGLGLAYLRAGNPGAALPQLLAATQREPGYVPAWIALGDGYVALGNKESAIYAYCQALQRNSEADEARRKLEVLGGCCAGL